MFCLGIEKFERIMETSICIFDNKLLEADQLIAPLQLDPKKRKSAKNHEDTLGSMFDS